VWSFPCSLKVISNPHADLPLRREAGGSKGNAEGDHPACTNEAESEMRKVGDTACLREGLQPLRKVQNQEVCATQTGL